jgi:hypothetical protein
MKVAIGPWRIGAKTAHYMLVLLTYRYNVKTFARRCGGYDFGHCDLHLIDRIQLRIQEIYNVLIWARHKNTMIFKGLDDFISVGIRPMTYDSRFVEKSDVPSANLSNDLKFIAQQMKIKYPITPVNSKVEKRIYNDFFVNNRPTNKTYEELAEIYREQADGVNVFYKTPELLKSYFKKWENNQEIKTAEAELDDGAKNLLRRFFFNTGDKIAEDITVVTNPRKPDSQIQQLKEAAPEVVRGAEFEDVVCEINADNVGSPHLMHVGHPQVPDQTEYVAFSDIPQQKKKSDDYRCAAFPLCSSTRSVCGGYQMTKCRFVGAMLVQSPSLVEQVKRDKRKMKNKRDNDKKANQRRRMNDEK